MLEAVWFVYESPVVTCLLCWPLARSLARLLSGRSRLQVPTEQSNGSHFIPLHHDLHGLSLPIAVLGAAMIMSNER